MIGNCVLSYKNAPRRCALGARGGLPPDSPIHTIDDLERNHDAGMNEYVAQTLESKKLIALITKYVVLK